MRALLLILTAVIGYVLGNLSGGMILSGYVFRKNRQKYMSTKVDFAEFYRDFGPLGVGLLTLFDILRTLAAVLLGGALLGIKDQALVGRLFGLFCLLLGNNFPALFLFRGGRGLLCACVGAFLVDWRIGLCCTVAYIVVIIFTRYEALGAVAGAVLAPIFMWIFGFTGLEGVLALLCALLIVIRCAENLVRIAGGTEPRLNIGRPRPLDDDYDDGDDADDEDF